MPVKAVLFDLDGTLVDTEQLGPMVFARVWNEMMGGVPPTTEFTAVWRRMRGADPLPVWLKKVAGPNASNFQTVLLSEYKKSLAEATPLPGAEELLDMLSDLGIPVAVVSASTRDQIKVVLDRYGWRRDVEAIISTDELNAHKPSPAGYVRACEELGVDPSEALVIEDSIYGITAGVRAGCYVIAVRAGSFDYLDAGSMADVSIDTLFDVLPMLAIPGAIDITF